MNTTAGVSRRVYGAVLAGGSGSRMGKTEKPKQFLEVAGKPIIVHSVERFCAHDAFDKVLVVTPEAWIGHTETILSEYIQDMSRVTILAGGDTRNETLMNAVRYIEQQGKLDEDTVIVTHDAVRPFVTERMITESIEAAAGTGACITAVPSTDTIVKSKDGERILEVPDRSELYQVQTPQSFRAAELKRLYESLTEEEKFVLTDAGRIFVMKNRPVEIVRGETYNIKITYPDDIIIAQAIYSIHSGE